MTAVEPDDTGPDDRLLLAWAVVARRPIDRDAPAAPDPLDEAGFAGAALAWSELERAAPVTGTPLPPREERASVVRELVARGLLVEATGGQLAPTVAGRRRADLLHRRLAARRFDDLLATAARSRRHARHLAQHLPGAPEGSFGLLDGTQVVAIASALGPRPGTRLLELGAGNGGLSRYLAARGARVTAVDSAERAMERLGTREPGIETLSFDLDDPDAPRRLADRGPWDAVVAADVLYFLERLEPLVEELTGALVPRGRVVFLVSELSRPGEEAAGGPRQTRLGRLLGRIASQRAWALRVVDLAAAERRFWERQARGLEASGPERTGTDRAEDDLFRLQREEALRALPAARAGRLGRFLYRLDRT